MKNLGILLSELEFDFDIIGLSETWNSTNSKSCTPKSINGYHPYEFISGTSQNSACVVYVKDNINFIRRNDLSLSFKEGNHEFETLFIEIINSKTPNVIIGTIYRHPQRERHQIISRLLKQNI